ncbi:MAG: AsmA-like C-terminal region-containing protein [Planctomycetota bacterium]
MKAILRRWLLRGVLGLVLVGAAIGCLLASPLLEYFVARQLSEMLGATVRLGDADLGLDGVITLRGVEVLLRRREPEMRLGYASLIRVDAFDGFTYRPRVVTIEDADLFAIEREEGGFELPQIAAAAGEREAEWQRLPKIALRKCRLHLLGSGPARRAFRQWLQGADVPRIERLSLELQPSADGTSVVRGDLELYPLGRVELRGKVTGFGSSLELMASLKGWRLDDLSRSPAWHADIARFAEANRLAGMVDLQVGYRAGGPAGAALSASALLADGRAAFTPCALPLEGVSAELRLEGDTLRCTRLEATSGPTRVTGSGQVEKLWDAGEFEGRVQVTGLELGDELRSVLDPALHRGYDDFAPRGPLDLECRLTGSLSKGTLEPHVEVQLNGVSASYDGHLNPRTGRWSGFPYRLHDLRGRVQVEPGLIRLQGLRGLAGEEASSGAVTLSGDIRDAGSVYELAIRCEGVRVGEKLRHAIYVAAGEAEGQAFDQFDPAGTVDAGVRVVRSIGEPSPHVFVDVTLRDVTASYEVVPYPLEQMRGRLQIEPGKVTMRGLQGRHGDAIIVIDGLIELAREGGPAPADLHIRGRRVPLDEELRAAVSHEVAPESLEVFEQLGISGEASFHMHFVRRGRAGSGAGRPRYLLSGRVERGRVRPQPFPLPVEDVTAEFRFGDLQDGVFTIEVPWFEGHRGGGLVRSSYYSRAGGDRRLDVEALEQALDPDFLVALEAASPRDAILLRECRLRGTLDLEYSAVRDASGQESATAEVTVRDGGVSLAALPHEFERIDGHMCIELGAPETRPVLHLEQMTARFGKGLVSVSEARIASTDGRLELDMVGTATDIQVSTALTQTLHQEVQEFFQALAPAGEADISPLRLSLVYDRSRTPALQMRYSGELLLRNAVLEGVIPATALRGTLQIEGQRGEGSRAFDARATVSNLEMLFQGCRFEGLSAHLSVTPDGLAVENLQGNVAGGLLPPDQNAFFIGLDPPYPFRGRLVFEDADLQQVGSPGGSLSRPLQGRLAGVFDFTGEAEHVNRLQGTGRLQVREGQLWELPLFATLFRKGLLRNLGVGSVPVFDEGHVDFRVAQGEIVIDEFVLESPALKLSGRGRAGPSGLNLTVVPSVAPSIPVLGIIVDPIFDLIKRGTLAFQVAGPFDNPEIAWNPGILSPFGGPESAPDWPILPAPGRLPERKRF